MNARETVLCAVRSGYAARTALTRRTGLAWREIAGALRELEAAGLVRREGPLGLWRAAEGGA